jgi:Fur family transcriptional regulator, peroxide stress response regulator
MLEKYVKTLRNKQIKITPQRLEILQYLDIIRNHPTVDEIYKALKKKNPSLSKTTVYNSVEILKNKKIIQSISIRGSESRYDYRTDMHHHFICKNCKKIIDIDITCPIQHKKYIQGHRVDEIQGYFIGLCKDCQKKDAN